MRNSSREDLAHRALLLRAMRAAVRRGWLPRARREALLPRRLLRHVRAQVRRLQQAHHGELYLRAQHTVAPRLLRMQGQYLNLTPHRSLQATATQVCLLLCAYARSSIHGL